MVLQDQVVGRYRTVLVHSRLKTSDWCKAVLNLEMVNCLVEMAIVVVLLWPERHDLTLKHHTNALSLVL